ncbi:hypothetical protein Moror_8247 [Moniliophthora roreri MCA 2997]|uniref:Uncharacterized protein n=2 Tax=Moniliophthora roreri TaxID=221103 RepID=V2XKL2_MONRO|nr:hypothetical protein Moror_8247 [Moniliophthora roreri MCA 2997]KAI3607618.1 hypothetical protein WG66_005133 [Moniliophthora roreri]
MDQQRPSMRRKSSAQNLLSSFKSPQLPPIQPSQPVQSASYHTPAVPVTPITTTPMAREWDAQSLHSDSLPTPATAQSTSDEYLRDLVQKRILTLTYIRNIHEGRSHWFHTILISRADLDREFNNNDMKKRTHSFAILGLSLSSVLDIHQPHDLLRALITLLNEYESAKPEDLDKNRLRPTRRLFGARTKSNRRTGAGVNEYSGTVTYSDDSSSYLITPHMPFPLDYHQTLLSLLDVLSEVYNKIAKLIGPSALPHAPQHMMGPLGLLAPHPGVTYLFTNEPQTTQNTIGSPNPNIPYRASPTPAPAQTAFLAEFEAAGTGAGSLWEIANGGPAIHGGGNATGWNPAFGEMVLKIDGKFKKITSTLLKELDQFARTGIKEELASLDPLLRNIKMPDLDFEGL